MTEKLFTGTLNKNQNKTKYFLENSCFICLLSFVGKTELAKQVARYLHKDLKKVKFNEEG